jgi:putative ABC transport system permease protein
VIARRRFALPARDLMDDVVVSISRSPLRSILLGAGAFVGCGVLALSIVTSSTEASRVANRFDSLAATRLQVDLPMSGGTYERLEAEHLRALGREPGVVATSWFYERDVQVTSRTEPQWRLDTSARLFDVSGDPAVLQVAGTTRTGVLGAGVWVGGVADLGERLPSNAVIELDGRPAVVAGVLRRSQLNPELLTGLVRYRPARTVELTRRGRIVVQVRPGWADVVARTLRHQLEPVSPDLVRLRFPPEAVSLRAEVVTTVDSLVLVVTAALLLTSAVAVGLATFARALERRRLIGLLRAIGASRSSIVVGLVTEAAVIGMLAGGIGALVGTAGAVIVASDKGGTVIPWTLIAGALAIAFVVNGLGAMLPAWAATRTLPIRAIRDV